MLWVDGGAGVNQSSILWILSVRVSAFPPDHSKSISQFSILSLICLFL